MNRMSLFAIALAASYVPAAMAVSDGYLEWTSVTFEDAAGWRVHMATAGDRTIDGFKSISDIEVSRLGVAVEIPKSAIAGIRDPLLDEVRILSMCCSDEVKLEIPVFQTDELRSLCKDRRWEISIINGKFSAATRTDSKDESGNCG